MLSRSVPTARAHRDQRRQVFSGSKPSPLSHRLPCAPGLLHSGGVCDLVDLKTTEANIGESWPKRTLFDIGADIQDCWYRPRLPGRIRASTCARGSPFASSRTPSHTA